MLHAHGLVPYPDGKVMQPPCEVPLRTYQVVLKDEDVFADLKRNAAGEP